MQKWQECLFGDRVSEILEFTERIGVDGIAKEFNGAR